MQEIFNEVWNTLKARDFTRAGIDRGDGFQCRYRSPNGPCAIGIFLTDKQAAAYEDRAVDYINLAGTKLKNVSRSFLRALQEAHDEGETPGIMRGRLVNVARFWNLEVPE